MSAAEAKFRRVERTLNEKLSALSSNVNEIAVRDLSARSYHYKNQVLTWSHQSTRAGAHAR